MKNTFTDHNFLGGHLFIDVDEETNTITGHFDVYDSCTDEVVLFKATTTCDSEDLYHLNKGVKIVKLKLVRKFYSYKKNQARLEIEKLDKKKKELNNTYVHSHKKIKNVEAALAKHGLIFH